MRADSALESLDLEPDSPRTSEAFETALVDVMRNRAFVREEIASIKKYEGKKRKSKKWQLVNSIWGPRKKSASSGDFYDTIEVVGSAFECDWQLACERLSLSKKVARASDKLGEEQRDASPLGAMHDAMMPYARLIYQVFDYYAHFGSDDIFSVTKNSYMQFVRDLALADNDTPGQRNQDMELMFEAANATAKKEDVFNAAKALNRQEWIGILVQLILVRHVVGHKVPITPSVNAFFEDDLRPGVPPEALHDANSFRSDFCYTEETDQVLKRYESSLRNVYEAFAFGRGDMGNQVLTTKLLDHTELFELINKLDLIDPFITMRDVRFNFLASRMLVVDENTVKGRRAVVQITFEDFLEMVVRLAYMMALPHDQDLAKPGVKNAGEYLGWLGTFPVEHERFKAKRTRKLGAVLDQPIAHKVRHFIDWMLFKMTRKDSGTAADGPLAVSKKEVEKFKEGFARGRYQPKNAGEPQVATNVRGSLAGAAAKAAASMSGGVANLAEALMRSSDNPHAELEADSEQ